MLKNRVCPVYCTRAPCRLVCVVAVFVGTAPEAGTPCKVQSWDDTKLDRCESPTRSFHACSAGHGYGCNSTYTASRSGDVLRMPASKLPVASPASPLVISHSFVGWPLRSTRKPTRVVDTVGFGAGFHLLAPRPTPTVRSNRVTESSPPRAVSGGSGAVHIG